KDLTDDPNMSVRLLHVRREHDVGALDDAEAIAMTFVADDGREFTVFGLRFDDGDATTCSFGSIPGSVSRAAKRITLEWARGELAVDDRINGDCMGMAGND